MEVPMYRLIPAFLCALLLAGCGSTLSLGEAGTSLSGHGTIRFHDPVTDTLREAEAGFSVVLMTAEDDANPGESMIIHCAVITDSPVGVGAVVPPFSHPKCLKEAGGPYAPFRFQLVIPRRAALPAEATEEPAGESDADPGSDSGDSPEAPPADLPVEEPDPKPEPDPELEPDPEPAPEEPVAAPAEEPSEDPEPDEED
jgi:hypothetical protein